MAVQVVRLHHCLKSIISFVFFLALFGVLGNYCLRQVVVLSTSYN